MPKQIINIFFLLIIAITSLPLKQASRCFFKKDAQEEMCSDCCDAPIKKSDDSIGFKDFPCCRHYGYGVVLHPPQQVVFSHMMHANWRLPLWPAVEIHTPPPNQA